MKVSVKKTKCKKKKKPKALFHVSLYVYTVE